MVNDDKFHRLIFLLMFNIFVLASSVVLLNFTYAAAPIEVHGKTLYEIANQTSSKENPHVRVGKGPNA